MIFMYNKKNVLEFYGFQFMLNTCTCFVDYYDSSFVPSCLLKSRVYYHIITYKNKIQ